MKNDKPHAILLKVFNVNSEELIATIRLTNTYYANTIEEVFEKLNCSVERGIDYGGVK